MNIRSKSIILSPREKRTQENGSNSCFQSGVFCPGKLSLINCICILVFLVLFYFRNAMPVNKAAVYKYIKALAYLCIFSAWYILMFLRGFVLYFHSQSFSKCVTPRRTMKSMALVFVVIILFLESCRNACLMETRSLISCWWRNPCKAEGGSRSVNTEARCGCLLEAFGSPVCTKAQLPALSHFSKSHLSADYFRAYPYFFLNVR